MLADTHKDIAGEIEGEIQKLSDARTIIMGHWMAAFHWIAFGCHQRHGRHHEKPDYLARYLYAAGERDFSRAWEAIDRVYNEGWFGPHADGERIERAAACWQEIRAWALSSPFAPATR